MAPKFDEQMSEIHDMDEYKNVIKSLDSSITTEAMCKTELMIIKKNIKENRIKVKYEYKLVGESGEKYGRLYSACGYQVMPSVYRHHFARNSYIGLDLNNCHPNLLNCLFKFYSIDCPEMNDYCSSRNKVIDDLGVSKSFINMICNTEVFPTNTIKEFKTLEFFSSVHSSVYDKLLIILKEREFFMYKAVVKNKKQKNIKLGLPESDNVDGAFIATYLMTLENKIIIAVKNFLEQEGYSVDAIVHDEILIKKDKIIDDVLLDRLNCVIKNSVIRGLPIDFELSFKKVKFQEYDLFERAKIRANSKVDDSKDDYIFEDEPLEEDIIAMKIVEENRKFIKVVNSDNDIWVKNNQNSLWAPLNQKLSYFNKLLQLCNLPIRTTKSEIKLVKSATRLWPNLCKQMETYIISNFLIDSDFFKQLDNYVDYLPFTNCCWSFKENKFIKKIPDTIMYSKMINSNIDEDMDSCLFLCV